jgi:uncharacterized protein YqgC (DUF456 family)
MGITAALVLVLVLGSGWIMQLIGLPGIWLIVVTAAGYAWFLPPDSAGAIGWGTVAALLVLAVLAEILEFIAGALGVTKAGGSRRGAVLAIVGSIVGSIVGLFVGVPVPIIGSLVAAVLFGGLGALAGAVLGETWKGRDFDSSLEVGKAAFIGRTLGTLAKTAVCTVMVLVTLAALVL